MLTSSSAQTHHRLWRSLNCQDLISDGELDALHFSFIIHSVEETSITRSIDVIIVITRHTSKVNKLCSSQTVGVFIPSFFRGSCFCPNTLQIFLHRLRYLKATLLLSSGPLTTTPVAPPERTANTCSRETGRKRKEKTDCSLLMIYNDQQIIDNKLIIW